VNTHILINDELNGKYEHDVKLVYAALRDGHCFIGYDLPAPTKGFRFSGQGEKMSVMMGDEITLGAGVTLQVSVPVKAELRLMHHGQVVAHREADTHLMHVARERGAYRIEAYLEFKGEKRGWIFSNPIYVR
jgi:hypothetical protein